jgi:hypothetical protein
VTRALGFVTGVCLTVAGFALVVERWQNQGHESTQVMMEPARVDGSHVENQSNPIVDCRAASRLAMTGETPQAAGAVSGTHPPTVIARREETHPSTVTARSEATHQSTVIARSEAPHPSTVTARSEATHRSTVIARSEVTKQSPTGYSAAEPPCIETTSAVTDDQPVTNAPGEETIQITDGQPNTAPVPGTDSSIIDAAAPGPVSTNPPPADAEQPSPARQSSATRLAGAWNEPAQASIDEWGGDETTRSHIFWSPFRSQWAAEGFARRLTNATQIPIEVVEAGSGQYRVAFDYRDEGQRLEHIERIESITGLKLE